jgi:hypothetical protein
MKYKLYSGKEIYINLIENASEEKSRKAFQYTI